MTEDHVKNLEKLKEFLVEHRRKEVRSAIKGSSFNKTHLNHVLATQSTIETVDRIIKAEEVAKMKDVSAFPRPLVDTDYHPLNRASAE